MTEIALLKFVHLLALVYWLGGDLGVFYSSFYLVDERGSPESRVTAGRILFGTDLGPRLCMPLILAPGIQLAVSLGFMTLPSWAVPLTWTISLGWMAMVLVLHFAGHGRDLKLLTRFDTVFRIAVALIMLLIGVMAIAGIAEFASPWAGWKITIFAILVVCGLGIRFSLRPFAPAFVRLARGEAKDTDDAVIRRSINSSRKFVIAIYAGLLFNTALGLHLL